MVHILDAAFAIVIVRGTVLPRVLGWWRRRRALIRDAKEDLEALNSPTTFALTLDTLPQLTSHAIRRGVAPVAPDSIQALHRRNHKSFCAKWARTAKVRFNFAQDCVDTPLNRAALQRWLRTKWLEEYAEQLRNREHRLDVVLSDTLDMCFLPTHEFMTGLSKRAVRRRARMEYYNERKYVEGWK